MLEKVYNLLDRWHSSNVVFSYDVQKGIGAAISTLAAYASDRMVHPNQVASQPRFTSSQVVSGVLYRDHRKAIHLKSSRGISGGL
jgi:hypothetical protein